MDDHFIIFMRNWGGLIYISVNYHLTGGIDLLYGFVSYIVSHGYIFTVTIQVD